MQSRYSGKYSLKAIMIPMSSLYRKFEIGLVSYLGKQSLHTSQVAYQANASLGFLSMKQLAVFLFPAR